MAEVLCARTALGLLWPHNSSCSWLNPSVSWPWGKWKWPPVAAMPRHPHPLHNGVHFTQLYMNLDLVRVDQVMIFEKTKTPTLNQGAFPQKGKWKVFFFFPPLFKSNKHSWLSVGSCHSYCKGSDHLWAHFWCGVEWGEMAKKKRQSADSKLIDREHPGINPIFLHLWCHRTFMLADEKISAQQRAEFQDQSERESLGSSF